MVNQLGRPEMKNEEKIPCKTPIPRKKTVNIPAWKYNLVSKVILKAAPKREPGILFKKLPAAVDKLLSVKQKEKLGSLGWYTTTVKLDMEIKGSIRRVSEASPQRFIKC